MNEFKNHGKKWFYWLTLGVALILVYKLLDQLTNIAGAIGEFINVIRPILAGAAIAYLLYIPAKKTENFYKTSRIKLLRNKARIFSIFTVYVVMIVIISICITLIAPVVIDSAKELVNNLQTSVVSILNKYEEVQEDTMINQEIAKIVKTVQEIDLAKYFNLDNITTYAKGAIGVFTGIFDIFLAFIVSIYVLSERNRIYNFFKRAANAFLSKNNVKILSKYLHSANKIFIGFITSQLLDAFIVSVLVSVTLSIMGVKYAPLLGVMIGVFNIIPYVGAIIGVGISAIITVISGGISQAIWLIVIITIIQQIDANIINPKIIGNSLKISPILVISAVAIGGKYWGMVGIFIAVPICALIKIVAEDYIEIKTKQKRAKQLIQEDIETNEYNN